MQEKRQRIVIFITFAKHFKGKDIIYLIFKKLD